MTFDVLVIGAGSGGCAIAGRLARTTDLAIGLVEAGPDYGRFEDRQWPRELLDPRVAPTTHDWGYVRTTVDPNATRPYSRARVVGGCSAHNQCAALWPFAEDYNGWSLDGLAGWTAAELEPLIRQIELDVQRSPQVESELGRWQRCFFETALEAGYVRLPDLSRPEPPVGVAPFDVNIRHGVRWNSAFTFLDPVRDQDTVTLFTDTLVEKLVIRRGQGLGVLCHSVSGDAFTLETDQIVLAAGAIGSPLLLMRSGVGPADHLTAMNVDCQVNLPGVGENLHDHHGVRVILEPMADALDAIQRDQASGQPAQSQVILRERSSHSALPDLHLLPADVEPYESTVKVMVMNMAPRSRGHIRLSGPDSGDPPQIDFGFFTDARDLDVVLEGVERVRQLRKLGRELAPAGQVDERLYVRNNATSYAHAAGTCRMGTVSGDGAVVNDDGRVYGLDNVWVADASIMPRLPHVNPNLACYLIGFRLAETMRGNLFD